MEPVPVSFIDQEFIERAASRLGLSPSEMSERLRGPLSPKQAYHLRLAYSEVNQALQALCPLIGRPAYAGERELFVRLAESWERLSRLLFLPLLLPSMRHRSANRVATARWSLHSKRTS